LDRKGDLSVSRGLGGGALLQLVGSYRHTDFLLRRVDQNRVPTSIAETQEGRPVFGTLVKQGGMLSAEPGSNRRFSGFDQVSALVPNGFSDNYEVTVSLDRRVTRGLSFNRSYLLPHSDNLVGALEPDPPISSRRFPGDRRNAWDEVARTSTSRTGLPRRWVSGGGAPVSVTARFRWRMGSVHPWLPSGVDAKRRRPNDRLWIRVLQAERGAGEPELLRCAGGGVRAERCREASLSPRSPAFSGLARAVGRPPRRAAVDAAMWCQTGLVDRALVLVDPNQRLAVGDLLIERPPFRQSNFGAF
jgi:hypothetical protein